MRSGLRLAVHGRYNIYFRVNTTETIIVRVVHSARYVRRLRFDENGQLLTRLPQAASPGEGALGAQGPLPALDLDNSRLTLRKQGHPDIVLTDVTLRATPDGGRLALSGSGASPKWGKLNLTGTVDPKAGSFALTLTSAATVRVTQAMLDALPVVPPSVSTSVSSASSRS